MSYSRLEVKRYPDGASLHIEKHHNMYVATLFKTKNSVESEYIWEYEGDSLREVRAWVKRVRKNPLPYKRFQSGTYWLPRNNGFGNPDCIRRVVVS